MLFEPYVRVHIFSTARVTEWPPIGEYLLTRLIFPPSVCRVGIYF